MQPKTAAKDLKESMESAIRLGNQSAIRADIDNLKSDASSLARNVKAEGQEFAKELKSEAANKYEELRDTGAELMRHVERRVSEKPGQTLLMAVGAGIVLSFLFGRR